MSSGVFQESVPSTHKVRDTLVHHNLTDDDQPASPHDWHLTVAVIHTIRANWVRVRFSKRTVHLNPDHDNNGLRDTLPATPRHSQLYIAAKVVAGYCHSVSLVEPVSLFPSYAGIQMDLRTTFRPCAIFEPLQEDLAIAL